MIDDIVALDRFNTYRVTCRNRMIDLLRSGEHEKAERYIYRYLGYLQACVEHKLITDTQYELYIKELNSIVKRNRI